MIRLTQLSWRHATLLSIAAIVSSPLRADLPCAADLQIIETFANGAAWQMCRQNNSRENLVLSHISYRPANGEFYSVMASMRLSQLHVTYDDSNVTYNDVTQYGLGGEFMSTLSSADCPGGQLLTVGDRAGICLRHQQGANGKVLEQYRSGQQSAPADSFTLSSVSQVGSYAYIASWQFFADGAIRPSIGAAGALQRSSSDADSPFGRRLEGVPDKSWLSHTHNYYWRLDFDLGVRADDDYVREHSVISEVSGQHRRQQSRLDREAARATAADVFRSWEVVDGGSGSAEAQQIAYSLEPIEQGHRHVRPQREPYTRYDFFVTRQHDCERFASQNSRFNPDCGDDVLAYVNDESLHNADIVVWHRVSFHHVPRSEDQTIMHSHWDGFTLRPRYLHQHTPGHSGQVDHPSPFLVLPDRQHRQGATVSVPVLAQNADVDQPQLSATGLPPGIILTDEAVLAGQPGTPGQYHVALIATSQLDNGAAGQTTATFQWTISARPSGGSGASVTLLPLLALIWLFSRQYRQRS